jgi:putative hydrolase of the HAD superfamily
MISAVVTDFGGVLTTPLHEAFARAQDGLDIPLEAYGAAMASAMVADGVNPLFALERGELTEAEFLARMERGLTETLGRPVSLDGFGERLVGALEPNEPLFAYLRGLRDRGVRLALLTNNIREWEARWRALLPIDEVFELVVDSAFVGMRKPEHGIYELTLSRLGLPAEECVFLDDLEINVEAARELGMHGIVYRDADQAIADVDAVLARTTSS